MGTIPPWRGTIRTMIPNPPSKPFAINLIPCEQIMRDRETRQYDLRRVIKTFEAADFPSQPANLCIFAEVSDMEGHEVLILEIADAVSEEPIWSASVEIDVEDRQEIVQIAIPVNEATFPHAGEYRVQMLWEGQILLQRPIVMVPQTASAGA